MTGLLSDKGRGRSFSVFGLNDDDDEDDISSVCFFFNACLYALTRDAAATLPGDTATFEIRREKEEGDGAILVEDDEKGVDEDEEGGGGGEGRGGRKGGEGLEEDALLIKGGRVANDVDDD